MEKINDFGEKIGGAKKDLAAEYRRTISNITDIDLVNNPLSKIFPKPDFKQLVEDGILSQDQSIELNFLYDKIPPKPRQTYNYRVYRWLESTKKIVEGFGMMINGEVDSYSKIMLDNDIHAQYMLHYPVYNEMMKNLGFPYADVKLKNYNIRKNVGGTGYNLSDGKTFVGNYPTIENATDALKQRLRIKKNTEQNTKKTALCVYFKPKNNKEFYVGKIIQGKPSIQLSEKIFTTAEEAFSYLKEHRDELEQKWTAMNIKYEERRKTNRDRVGQDCRKGENITPEIFSETFGFRGVEFGNWVNQSERQNALNDAYDALKDMSKILNISPKALSLNGELSMAFGARGSGGASAHYEQGRVVINLTKTNGAGSLAHEWWHAIDNYFSRKDESKLGFQTERRLSGTGIRKEVADAFSSIMSDIRGSDFVKRAMRLDSTRSKDYWSTGKELSARAFENFIIEKLDESGYSNDYLANFKTMSEWLEKDGLDMNTYPYPLATESPKINEKFQQLFDTIEQKIDDQTNSVMLCEPPMAYRFSKKEQPSSESDKHHRDVIANAKNSYSVSQKLKPKKPKPLKRFSLH